MNILKAVTNGAAIAAVCTMALPALVSASPNVSVNINGFLPPPPPGVHIYFEGDRPYYMERERRVYCQKPNKHRHGRKHHEDRGRGHAHGRHKGHH